jgi:5,10-methylene-tetrahydrofolate dehydrogenase/methenyl tetrahydrofolate cyclohydrolase
MTQDEIDRAEFVCPYDECEMPATPCAYKEKNKVESYFKYKAHHPDCETTHNKKKKNSNLEDEQQAPFSKYINELREPATISTATRNSREASASATQKEKINDGRSSKYIEAIIDYYIEDPSRAKGNLIKLPGSKKSTYQSAFQLITSNKDYKGGHVFYCQISFQERFSELEGIVTLTLQPFASKE